MFASASPDFWVFFSVGGDIAIAEAATYDSDVTESFPKIPEETLKAMNELAKYLAEDSSHDVKAFAQSLLSGWSSRRKHETNEVTKQAAVFSRPPPLAPS
jgi:serine/threonine-protein phosphatase 4 regulatory subunit 1